uniref:DNA topoisomerase n=1 Tax=Sinocyclocheilus rhinocerous TaxID=307959 RepID=A0A673IDN2_9TELE
MNVLFRALRVTIGSRFYRQQSVSMIRRTQIKKVLCVAEKNDAAKGIAELMSNGRSRRREGYSVYNKIYEYEYHLFGQNATVSMTSVSGHLLSLEFKAPFQKCGLKPFKPSSLKLSLKSKVLCFFVFVVFTHFTFNIFELNTRSALQCRHMCFIVCM